MRLSRALLVLATGTLLAACGSGTHDSGSSPTSTSLGGKLMGGRQPVVGATVVVYESGLNAGDAPTQIGATTTDSNGRWNVATLSPYPSNGQVIYVTAQGGQPTTGVSNPQAMLMTVAGVWGNVNFPSTINTNELTTVAGAAQLQSYLSFGPCAGISGSTLSSGTCPILNGATGLSVRAASVGALVDVVSGQASTMLLGAASGTAAYTTLTKLNFQASVLASCINSAGGVAGDGSACGNLFDLARSRTSLQLTATSSVTDNYLPTGLAVNPNGNELYVVNQAINGLGTYTIGAGGVLNNIQMVNDTAYPNDLAVNPNGAYAYVPGNSSNEILTVGISSSSGTLGVNPNNYTVDTGHSNAIAVSADGKYAYVGESTPGTVATYAISTDGSTLTPTGTSVSTRAYGITVTPNGNFVYVTTGTGNTINIYSSSSGTLTSAGSETDNNTPWDVAVSPDGTLLFVTDWNFNAANGDLAIYSINSSTGALTLANTIQSTTYPKSVAVSPDGSYIFVSDFDDTTGDGDVTTYQYIAPTDTLQAYYNLLTGNIPNVANKLFALAPLPVVYSPIPSTAPSDWVIGGKSFVFASTYDNNVVAYSYDKTTGALSQTSVSNDGRNHNGLTLSPDGAYLYVLDDNVGADTYSVDPATGTLTYISTTNEPGGAFRYPINAVVTPDNAYLLVNDGAYTGGLQVYSIDPTTHELVADTVISDGSSTSGLALLPNSNMIYDSHTNGAINIIDYSSGSFPVTAATSASNSPYDIAFSPDGLFAYTVGGGTVVTSSVNSTGMLVQKSSTASGGGLAVTATSDGLFVYTANYNSNALTIYSVTPGTGALTMTGSYGLYEPRGIAAGP